MPLAIIPFLMGLLSKIPGLLTGINIPGLLSGVLTNIQKNWKVWLIFLLISLQSLTAFEWYHTNQLLIKEKQAHEKDVDEFKKVQALADAKAKQEKVILQTESKAAKNEADTNYTALLTQYDASLLRYATHSSPAPSTDHNQLSTPQSPDGPGKGSQLPPTTVVDLPPTITITGTDAQVCAENTARLQAAHDWALQQLTVEKQNATSNP